MKKGWLSLAVLLVLACSGEQSPSTGGEKAKAPVAAPVTPLAQDSPTTLPFASETGGSAPAMSPLRNETEFTKQQLSQLISAPLSEAGVRPPVAADSGRMIDFSADGVSGKAYLVEPPNPVPVTLLLVHEGWGLNSRIKREAEQFAALGYRTLVPDLFAGQTAQSRTEMIKLGRRLAEAPAQKTLLAAQAWLASGEATAQTRRVLIGWGLSGALAWQAALAAPQPPAALVIYYTDFPTDAAELAAAAQTFKKNNTAVLGLFAARDAWITPARVTGLADALAGAGVDQQMLTYETIPGFALDGSGSVSSGYAETARSAIDEFLHRRFF